MKGVSKTAVLTLRARADEHARPEAERYFADARAHAWSQQLPWPSELDRWYTPFAQAKTALRAYLIDLFLRALVAGEEGEVLVVELGCGYSTRSDRVRQPGLSWLMLDLPDVIAARAELGDQTPSIASSVLDTRWIQAVRGPRVVLIAEGLLYYLPRAEVDQLFATLRERLPGVVIVFDVTGQADLGRSARLSAEVDAPISWALEPPFADAQQAFGLGVVPGLEPDVVVQKTIAGFGKRYGPAFAAIMRATARLPWQRGRQSGVVVGRL